MSEQFDARLPLSVLVPVKNEAANLRDCPCQRFVRIRNRGSWFSCRLLASYERMIALKGRELKDRRSNSSAVSYTL
jgi:hypothetical protein